MKLPPTYPGGARIGQREEDAVVETIRSRRLFRYYGLSDGPSNVALFETEVARQLGVDYATAVCSGTAALTASLAAIGAGPGDEVIVPAYAWMSTASCVLSVGAVPVIAEVDESLTIDPLDLPNVISSRTKAIIAVNMRGAAADLDAVIGVADSHGIAVIEDNAQSMGGSYRGRQLGTIGAIGIYSLQFNKIITAGEGGIVVSNDEALIHRANMYHDVVATLRDVGSRSTDAIVAQTLRMSELQGAVARVQLTRLEGIVSDARRIQRAVIDGISSSLTASGVRLRPTSDPAGDIGICIVLLCTNEQDAREVESSAVANGLPAYRLYEAERRDFHVAAHWDAVINRRWFSTVTPWDLHDGPVVYDDSRWGKSISILGRAVHIDLSPELNQEQIAFVVDKLNSALSKVGTVH